MVEKQSDESAILAKEFVSKAIANLVKTPDHASIKNMIEKVSTYNQDFECIICLTLVYDPYQCQKCEATIFCRSCLDSLQQKEQCPSCRSKPFVYHKMNKFGLKCLGGIQVSCPGNQCASIASNITYDYFIRHLETSCNSVSIQCVTDLCTAVVPRSQLPLHLLTECHNA